MTAGSVAPGSGALSRLLEERNRCIFAVWESEVGSRDRFGTPIRTPEL